jgi:fatty acid desaturase
MGCKRLQTPGQGGALVVGGERDYSLTGRDSELAVQRGLATAQWYCCPIERRQLKALMQRRDLPAVRDTLIWIGALVGTGLAAYHWWGQWAAVPFFGAYGVLYGSASDSRWHECSHGTAFRSHWLNEAVYLLACVMIVREPTIWRWSHVRHHTDTLIVGRDPEIQVQRPPDLLALALDVFALRHIGRTIAGLIPHALGRLTAAECSFVPEAERWKVAWGARIGLCLIGAVTVWCITVGSVLPAMFIGLPSIYGAFMGPFFATTQHAGLAEDVLDHRLNSRTVYMNPLFRFLYWNMNYHVEHHVFPLVPYHALPELHRAVKPHCPPPYRSCWQAYREIIPALLRQRRDPGWFVRRPLPAVKIAAAAPAGAMTVESPT